MKIRSSFVSNSSSSAYVIKNITTSMKYLEDFVRECGQKLIEKWNKDYASFSRHFTIEDLLNTSQQIPIQFDPGKEVSVYFGDHEGPYAYTSLGYIGDYCLRNGIKTESFEIKFVESCR